MRETSSIGRWPALLALVVAQGLGPAPVIAQAPGPEAPSVSASGLPVPRFVSLKSDRVNLRSGPGTDYPTAWVYRRAGLPPSPPIREAASADVADPGPTASAVDAAGDGLDETKAVTTELSPDEVTRTLNNLADLRDRGAITPAEYEAKKADLLSRL